MKIIVQTIVLFGTIFFTIIQVNSVYDYIEINNHKKYFLDYNSLPLNYVEDIENGNITFQLQGNHKYIEAFCGKLGCFFVNNSLESIKDSGDIIIENHLTNNFYSIPYEIDIKKEKKSLRNLNSSSFDISDNMKTQTIQKRALSCEISATADILTHLLKRNITEDSLLNILDKSKYNSLPYKKNNKLYWGNPQEGFVGYIDILPAGGTARQRKMTGYGVLEEPIKKIFHSYGIKTQIITQNNYTPNFSKNEHLTLILEEVKKGNMVQLWGDICTDPKYYNGEENPCYFEGKPSWDSPRKLSWNYKDLDGNIKQYNGLNGEHAFYLLGYKGDTDKPSHIIVWDTYTGKHTYITSEWMRKWKKMQYKSIIAYAQ